MNETNVKTRQLELLTYENGTNHYYDSTFSVPLDFKPNARGLYNVTINEVLFMNDECLLEKDKDFFELTAYNANNAVIGRERHTLKENIISTEDTPNHKKINNILSGDWDYVTVSVADTKDGVLVPINNKANAKFEFKLYKIKVRDGTDAGTDTQKLEEVGASNQYFNYLVMSVKWKAQDADPPIPISKITLKASNNFLYIFRNLFNEKQLVEKLEFYPDAKIGPDDHAIDHVIPGTRYFEIHNYKRNGPIVYVLDTNINATSKTINENGQVYNVMAKTYNLAKYHNSIQQMNSTMQGTVKDLTNLRLRVVNDFFEPVRLFTPVRVTMTVSNSD